MHLTTNETVAGRSIASDLGLVQGNTIRSKNIGKDIGAGLKSLVGGELRSYTAMMAEARDEAIARMVAQATERGATAIVGVRFTTSMVVGGASEILAYGTAVELS